MLRIILIWSFVIILSTGTHAAVECFSCKSNDVSCVNATISLTNQKDCEYACLASVTVAVHYDDKQTKFVSTPRYERLCADDEVVDKLMGATRTLRSGEIYCDSLNYKAVNLEQNKHKQIPLRSYYCVCRTDLCNGKKINHRMQHGRKGSVVSTSTNGGGRSAGGEGSVKFILLCLGILVLSVGRLDVVDGSVTKCIACTDRTHKSCMTGTGETGNCRDTANLYGIAPSAADMGCIKVKVCIGDYSCSMWRGCGTSLVEKCLRYAAITYDSQTCSKTELRLNSLQGSLVAICLNDLKNFYEMSWSANKKKTLYPGQRHSGGSNDDEGKEKKDVMIQVARCFCDSNECNGQRAWKGSGFGCALLLVFILKIVLN